MPGEAAPGVPLDVDDLLQPESRQGVGVEVREGGQYHVAVPYQVDMGRLHLRRRLPHALLRPRHLDGCLRLPVEPVRRRRHGLRARRRTLRLRARVVELHPGLLRAVPAQEGLGLLSALDWDLYQLGRQVGAKLDLDGDHVRHHVPGGPFAALLEEGDVQVQLGRSRRRQPERAERTAVVVENVVPAEQGHGGHWDAQFGLDTLLDRAN
mmetsp:Transcript_5540/g.18367  ORF Transcript_5540/g.18367 Transcript_5540/m.18367 type:complete len:209 (-) Transcript_5540:470-1096(-)